MNAEYFLSNIWIGIIAFFLIFYAVTDGVDLGLGIMSLACRSDRERGMMIGSIESTWHANQTWLVIVGGMVFGAFPFFYAVVFSALYIPLMALLFSLIIRGVALDYRSHASDKLFVGYVFGVGSLLATIWEGFALGGLLSGIHVHEGHFAGSIWDWANPFSGLVTAGVIAGDVMLGSSFLILKAEGELQQRGYRNAWISAALLLPISGGVFYWMFIKYPHMLDKFTQPPDAYWVVAGPALAGISGILYFFSLWKRYEIAPMVFNAAIILFAFAGMSTALYPYMIPNVISNPAAIREAAASQSTLVFMGFVMAAVIPIILIYTAYNQFWVFRGKIRRYYSEEEAHEEE